MFCKYLDGSRFVDSIFLGPPRLDVDRLKPPIANLYCCMVIPMIVITYCPRHRKPAIIPRIYIM